MGLGDGKQWGLLEAWIILDPRVFNGKWFYKYILGRWLCPVWILRTGQRVGRFCIVGHLVFKDHGSFTPGLTSIFSLPRRAHCWQIPTQHLMVIVSWGRSRGSGSRWHRRGMCLVSLSSGDMHLQWIHPAMINIIWRRPWTPIQVISASRMEPPLVGWLRYLPISTASAAVEPASSGLSYGLLGMLFLLAQSMVHG